MGLTELTRESTRDDWDDQGWLGMTDMTGMT